jgi:2-polyprenyl-3-methyl-5-hydroxy-6-metoxy-1,4-benzoquinol methylase
MLMGMAGATDDFLAANRALWDEWTDIHETSEFYDLEAFRRGGIRLRGFEIDDVGSVEGKTLLHLQCHFGIDTLSWARLGARVTGADFSPKAVALARRLADELGIDASFVCSNVYDLPEALDGQFDIVYTSRGVLGWLPDMARWAQVAAGFVKPGGTFYIHEIHPVAQVWDDENVRVGELRLRFPYFTQPAPLEFDVAGSYADPTAHVNQPKEYGWNHSLAEIVTGLIGAGLRIDLLREFPYTEWAIPFLEERTAVPDGEAEARASWWLPEDVPGELPLMFALRARKPGR